MILRWRAMLRAGVWAFATSVMLLVCAPGQCAGVRLVDDWGRELRLPAAPSRIVSLAPHATELLAAVGLADALVAVDPNSDHPPAVRRLPRVSAYPTPDLEALVALRPDLVVLWGAGLRPERLAQIESLGIRVMVSQPRRLADVPQAMLAMGALAPDPRLAREQAERFESAIASLRARHREAAPVPVFVQLSARPLLTLSDQDPIGDALRVCGARNLFGDQAAVVPAVGPEQVLARAPAAVLVLEAVEPLQPWHALGLLAPRGRLHRIQADASISRPGPRLPASIASLCEQIAVVRKALGAR